MKTKCQGIIGEIFGHNFQSRLVEKNPPTMKEVHEFFGGNKVTGYVLDHFVKEFTTHKYKIICTRCGEEK